MKREIKKYLLTATLLAVFGSTMALAQDGGVVHVSQAEAMKAVKERVEPGYPAMARQLHLHGAVQLQAHISPTGNVEDGKPMTGNAVLMNAAAAAVKRWRFAPFTADGKPSKAVAELSFSFRL